MKIGSLMVKSSVLTEARTLTDSDAGRTFFLNTAGGFTVTLPEPRQGVTFEFIVKAAPTTDYIISTKDGDSVILGQVYSTDANTAYRPEFVTTGVANIRLAANIANIGDSIELVSDGTYWYAECFCSIYNAVELVEQSKSPSISTSISPSVSPSVSLSRSPSVSPSISLSRSPSKSPSASPSASPSVSPSVSPSISPSAS